MTPITLIASATFVFLLLPVENFTNQPVKRETEVNHCSQVNSNVIFNNRYDTICKASNEMKNEITEVFKLYIEFGIEKSCDTPFQVENWMKSPKSWNIYKE